MYLIYIKISDKDAFDINMPLEILKVSDNALVHYLNYKSHVGQGEK